MTLPLSPKQIEFVLNSTKHWNFAHGSVRSGKTVGCAFRFMHAVDACPDSSIYIAGHTFDTAYRNVVKLILESEEMKIFRPFCNWSGKKLYYKDKVITVLGAKDEGAVGSFQGDTYSIIYCNEMALYPELIINMIDTRLSRPHSIGFADMNPAHPDHILKQWIDKAGEGNPSYYALHFTIEDNPYLTEEYKRRIKESSTGVFYKRNYLGLWCMAEGAIFDFFDQDIYVIDRPPRAAEYWIAGLDYGTNNNFACIVVGVSTGIANQQAVQTWVEEEYVWDVSKQGRAKTAHEFADDMQEFLGKYGIQLVYVDPSALAFKLELQKRGFHVVGADNDVLQGIDFLTSYMHAGKVLICKNCSNLIRELGTYVWDTKSAQRGIDKPVKKDDHCFAASTLIHTSEGVKCIDLIKRNDLVLSTLGYKRVLEIHQTEAETHLYTIGGRKIECTSDHRFFTYNEGWKEAGKLTLSDILCIIPSWTNEYALNLMEENIGATQIPLDGLTDIISNAEVDITIETYGNIIMDEFPEDIIFITKMGIPSTIYYPIWSVFRPNCITSFIKKIFTQIILAGLNAEQNAPNGTEVKKDVDGIPNMQLRQVLEKMLQENSFASSVEAALKQLNSALPVSALINVKVGGEDGLGLIMKKETVSAVLRLLLQTNSQRPDFALNRVPVERGINYRKVYDLTVEDAHNYFANGVVVHNCLDALRYALYTHKPMVYDPKAHKAQHADWMQNRYAVTRTNYF